ncbi:MAG: histidinol-phosphate transaminase [bacterium]|nr:histidinol-phosphate transaminase [bacterium]
MKIRDIVKSFEPYIPGRSIDVVKKEFNLKKVIKLASNENSMGSSKNVLRHLAKITNLNRYPDSFSISLKKAISKKYGVSIKNIAVGSGSDEIIFNICLSLLEGIDNIVVSEGAFIRFKMGGKIMGSNIIEVPMKNFKHDLMAMKNAINEKTKIVFVANPNNPTGTYNNIAEVEEFLNGIRKDILVVFDQAYFEYASYFAKDYPDMINYFKKFNNIAVLRTFSKAYGLAGLRIGWAVMPEEVVDAIERIRLPFNITSVSQELALIALKDQDFIKKSVEHVYAQMYYIEREFIKLGVEYIPSVCNFVMFKINGLKGSFVFNELLKQGIIVRALDEYGFEDYVRVTIGSKYENKMFIKKLKNLIKIYKNTKV